MDVPHYEMVGLVLFCLLAALPIALPLHYAMKLRRETDAAARRKHRTRLLVAGAIVLAVYGVVTMDAYLIEPNWPRLERIRLQGNVDKPLTILFISDTHLEEAPARREAWLKKQMASIQADLVILGGDLHQVGNPDPASIQRVFGDTDAPLGVFGCIGFDNETTLEGGAPRLKVLENESVTVTHGKKRVGLAGLLPISGCQRALGEIAGCDYRIALNHTPDLADAAITAGVDLYLCGHTHGGQVRIPFWGAIITNSSTGKRYEAGLKRAGTTWLYTSRGFGLEPRPAPQVRFLCLPEIAVITVEPAS